MGLKMDVATDVYANELENLLFSVLDAETIANEVFSKLNQEQRIEMAQDILTDYDVSFPNREDM
jgi:hypothetical protein